MEFRILGPLEVVVDGQVAPIGAAKHRTLLACLLLRANRVVSVDELVDRIWDGDTPHRSKATLQTYVMRLRQVLGDPSVIRTAPDGYLISVDADHLDLLRFTDLAAAAQSTLATGDLPTAAELYGQALALWRGQPLVDVPSDVLHREEIQRLVERRLEVLERRIEVELSLGRHTDLIPMLRAVTGEHPFQERFWGQLMLALHRSGRQVEALEAFRQISRLLAEELGVGPGERLRALHQAVLRDDPGLAPPERSPRPPSKAVPSELPADLVDFVGRQEVSDRIAHRLLAGNTNTAVPLVTLSGPPGIGKTALAIHVAHQVSGHFPGGQLYVNLRGYAPGPPMSTVDALTRFLRALGVPPSQIPLDVEEQITLYRSCMAGRQVLVVLDNAAAAEQVRPLLPGSPGCAVLVTSRDTLLGLTALQGARPVGLDALTPDEATGLLGKMLGAEAVNAEPEAVVELAQLCANLPLALRIAAANLANRPGVANYVAQLRQGNRLDALVVDGDDEAAVHTAFDLSYHALKPAARQLFRLLGLIPGPDFTAEAAAAVASLRLDESQRLLDRLAAANLVQQHSPGRYQLHDLLRLYAELRTNVEENPGSKVIARSNLAAYYHQASAAASNALAPGSVRLPVPGAGFVVTTPRFGDHFEALAWLDAERANLIAAVAQAEETGPLPAAWGLADALHRYFRGYRPGDEGEATARIGLTAALRSGDRRAEAVMRQALGALAWDSSHYEEAIDQLSLALAYYREMGPDEALIEALTDLGGVYGETGDLPLAAACFEQALDVADKVDLPGGRATALSKLGTLKMAWLEYDEAVALYERALVGFRALNRRYDEASVLTNLGLTYLETGQPDKALPHLHAALDLRTELGSMNGRSNLLDNIAMVYLELEDLAQAEEYAASAVAQASQTGSRRGEATALGTLSEVAFRRGDRDGAVRQLDQAMRIAQEIDNRVLEAGVLIAQSRLHRRMGNGKHAVELARQALAMVESVVDPLLLKQAQEALALALDD
ncbi:BTAD domain-containing putative transcriptional regulator [Kutzneria buriramensis]|uniref:DNA-binding SARP family transcriptional activator n=1 Tax=Kutzneria buriramensis TaxID=1045776 RepID=A0A3E0HU87_9PSEU|nr:BTAD domain-containing putative transcriptional regulator [Kutzneria buriramensis]REH50112.1 DNA-binding SARP family transcriptional activator [Kutzneria buriramensis]